MVFGHVTSFGPVSSTMEYFEDWSNDEVNETLFSSMYRL